MARKFKFMQNYFYGKPNQKEFTRDDLPVTRPALFKCVLFTRLGSLCGLNLLYLLICLPAIVWTGFNVKLLIGLLSAETIEWQLIIAQMNTYVLILVPLVILLGPFNFAFSGVVRLWARDEHCFAFSGFKDFLKEDWKQGLLFGLMNGLSIPVIWYGSVTYIGMGVSSPLAAFAEAMLIALYLLWLMLAQVIPSVAVGYKLSFKDILKNALLMTFAQIFRAFGILILTFAAPLITLIAGLLFFPSLRVTAPLTLIYYILYALGVNKLLCTSFANYLCEKYMNPMIPGSRINIGLKSEKTVEETA